MAEPEQIIQIISEFFKIDQPLKGKKALVTAGPTYESIDPVRFIRNHSSGKMGFVIAEELARQGAIVKLVSGPSHQIAHHRNISRCDVNTAEEMFEESKKEFNESNVIVLAAAVADYKPINKAKEKIKKTIKQAEISLELTKTIDIAATLGKDKRDGQFIVGFALETENELANAKEKISKKNFDMIVLNSLKDKGAGFGYDTNKVTIITKTGDLKEFELKAKVEVAKDIVNEIINKIND